MYESASLDTWFPNFQDLEVASYVRLLLLEPHEEETISEMPDYFLYV
jgi:hypothetical protein